MKQSVLIVIILVSMVSCQKRGPVGPGEMGLFSMEHGGRIREYLIHLPAAPPQSPAPLLLVLHGGGGTAPGVAKLTKYRFNQLADSAGFFVVYPVGLGKSWNNVGSSEHGYARRENIDDSGFIAALIERLAATYRIDRSRVFAAGISNGGFMCYRLACEHADMIRGIAAVAATNPVGQKEACRMSRPVSVLIINGTDDPIVPYNGGDVEVLGRRYGGVTSTDDTLGFWADADACSGDGEERELPDRDPADLTRVTRISYGPCKGNARVELFRVDGGGHTWPGGVPYLPKMFVGRTSHDINACDEIWKFFSGLK